MRFDLSHRFGIRTVTIGIIATICVILLLIIPIIGGVLVIAYEGRLYANNLNNPYVNSDFYGWRSVEMDQGTLMFPENWEIVKDNEVMYIFRDEEKIAEGAIIKNSNALFQTDEAFFSKTLETAVTTVRYANLHSLLMSHAGKLYVNEEEQPRGFYIMLNKDGKSRLLFYFYADKNTESELVSIAEAIIYYYKYGK